MKTKILIGSSVAVGLLSAQAVASENVAVLVAPYDQRFAAIITINAPLEPSMPERLSDYLESQNLVSHFGFITTVTQNSNTETNQEVLHLRQDLINILGPDFNIQIVDPETMSLSTQEWGRTD